jgi:hypothetical protein
LKSATVEVKAHIREPGTHADHFVARNDTETDVAAKVPG